MGDYAAGKVLIIMKVSTALLERRTIRKFKQLPVDDEMLLDLINYARLAPFAGNVQALKYKIITDPILRDKIFNNVKWAGYLPKGTPLPDERPPAFIAVLGDTKIKESFETDAGAAITSILLGATDMGLGCCWMGAIKRSTISSILELPSHLSLLYVIAIGYPAEESRECEYKEDPKYYYNEEKVLQVPKLSVEDILL